MAMTALMGRRSSERVVLVGGHALVALLFMLAACMEICDAATVFDVYRVIQYDFKGIPLGSRRASLNHHASSGLDIPGSDLARTVVVLPIAKVNLTMINDYLQHKRLLGGLLLLLPQSYGSKLAGDSEEKDEDSDGNTFTSLTSLEQWAIHTNIPYPVYFVFENEKLLKVLEEVRQNDAAGRPATATTGGYKIVVPIAEPRKLQQPTLTNIQSWLPGLRGEGDAAMLPTIAIVAWYDTFGAAPALSMGSDSNGSGVAALLEIARLFTRLYANPKTRGRYNLLFGLTSGGPYNFDGTSKWLRNFDQRLRESIDYAICLNSVGSYSDKLWLHVSKPPENVYIKQIHDGLADVAKDLGITLGIRHKKINISDSRVAWEHEHFSRQRITAATLSEIDVAPKFLGNTGGLLDRRITDSSSVERTVKLVAESLARHIYGHRGKGIDIFADNSSLSISHSYIDRWLDLLSRTPRVAPFLPKNAPIVSVLHQELSSHIPETSVQHDTIDNTFVFYDSIIGQLTIYQVASVTFDLFIMLSVGAYLALLFVVLLVSTKGFDDLLRRSPSKKLKST